LLIGDRNEVLKLAVLGLLSLPSLQATIIGGKITDLTGQPLTSNRSVTFSLQNCGNNVPQVLGSSIIVPSTKTVLPNPAGLLTGSIIGNDVIECGTVIGQTYYS